ncbi:hypothetical protein [Geopseudomonas aromaticivorans]
MSIQSYLSVLADNDLFGSLATLCFLAGCSGLFSRIRNTRTHRALTFVSLMAVPALHAVGTFFLNQAPA